MHLTEHRFRHRFTARAACAAAGSLLLLVTTATAAGAESPVHARSTAPASASASADSTIVRVPVSFQVRNVNRSKVACHSDGRTYTVRGSLVAPASALARPGAVTLYLHGLSFGKFFWDFDAAGYNYATNQARAGLASVIIDRLGYGGSDKPLGTAICVGSRADIAHQMVRDLKTGNYRSTLSHPAVFDSVVLAGHSYGGQIAQVEAYSFGDIDGLIVISYTDVDQSAVLKKAAKYAAGVCATGGLPVAPGGPGRYAPFGPPATAPAALFHDVAPRILHAALPQLTLDPCGDGASFTEATRIDLTNVHRIHVPVLIIAGGRDALFPPAGLPRQAALYTGTNHVKVVTIAGTAHAVTLERTHHVFERAVARWLTAAYSPTPVGAPNTGGGSTAGTQHTDLIVLGVLLLLASGATMAFSRRRRGWADTGTD